VQVLPRWWPQVLALAAALDDAGRLSGARARSQLAGAGIVMSQGPQLSAAGVG
jgi:hypothetical protein